jgi:site-specific recombinase XerD
MAGEWKLIRTIADGLEWSHGWAVPAAQRLHFLLDFGYATGLRAGELASVTLGGIMTGTRGERWLHLTGKGAKAGKVVLPPLAPHYAKDAVRRDFFSQPNEPATCALLISIRGSSLSVSSIEKGTKASSCA